MIKAPNELQDLRRRLYVKAKAEPSWRFWGLYVHVCKRETLAQAYRLAKENDGAPGIDGVTFEAIEAEGVDGFLEQLRAELAQRTYRPLRVRTVEISKGDGGKRQLSIPTIRDRVVQGALKLILEPIFEADFQPGSFGYRPKKSAHDAVQRVSEAILSGKTYVIDLDLRAYFDTVRHHVLLEKVARRVDDDDVLHLLKLQLRASGKRGVPQGGVMTPPTQWVTLISRSSFPTGGESGPTREDDIKGSIIVALLIVCLCHGRFASSSSRSVRPAGQRRHPVARGWGFSRSGTSTGSPISIITTPSLALCGTGPQPRRGRGAQAQGGVYGEAADGPRSSCSPPRQAERTDPQCVGCARFEGVPGSFGWRFSRWRIGGLNWTTSSTA